MINLFFKLLILFFLSTNIAAREIGQTEILTDEGIEVFQNEKYYLLKKNVKIKSDTFELSGNLVKAFFDKDLYDIIKIESSGNVNLKSARGLLARGEIINFSTKNEDISVLGLESSLIYKNIQMFSDESIYVNNISGKFKLKGKRSELKTENINIFGFVIDGIYALIDDINEVQSLFVEDENEVNIITDKLNMFSKKAKYNKKENVIELFENVRVIRNNELITGDYAKVNTLNESYKIISNNKNKVKALISNSNE